MKYQVAIPPPSAKRLKNRKVVILLEEGWGSSIEKEHPIPADIVSFEFEVHDSYKYVYNTTEIDGDTFNVYVISTNDGGSRAETQYLVPMKL